MVSQYFLSSRTANFSLNYFVRFFQGQHLILSYSHSCWSLPLSTWQQPLLALGQQMSKADAMWRTVRDQWSMSGLCKGFQFHPSHAIFSFLSGKRWSWAQKWATEPCCCLGSVEVLTSHQVLLVSGEGMRAAVCLSSPPWLKGWINLQWAVSSGSFLLLLSASASGNEAGICLFWQVQPTWSLRSVTFIGSHLKVVNL